MADDKLVTIIHNPVVAKVVDPDRDLRMQISEALSYQVSGSEFMGDTSWGGKSSFFKFKTNTFPAGFVRLVKKRLERQGYKVTVKAKPSPVPLGPLEPKVDDFPHDPRYDYQPEVVRRLLSLKGMIARVATGGGKSRIFKLCCERIGRPTLFITTRKTLMYQMADAYKIDLKKSVGIIGDSIYEPNPTGVNFAIVDSLISRIKGGNLDEEYEKLRMDFIVHREVMIDKALKKAGLPLDLSTMRTAPAALVKAVSEVKNAVTEKNPVPREKLKKAAEQTVKKKEAIKSEMMDFLAKMEFVCLEEAHEVSSDSYYGVMSACKNAHYRLALTATPFMKDDEEANMRLMAVTGPIGIVVTEKQLIDCGILAKPYFKYLSYLRPEGVLKNTPWQKAYKKGIVDNKVRNEMAIKECIEAKRYGLPVMILVQQTSHGKLLDKALKEKGMRSNFISGESKQDLRSSQLKKLGGGELDVLIGSTILDVGVDVPSVGVVILAGGGKAEVALRQRIGRGMREKKKGPNVVFIVDFDDSHNNHLTDHARQRKRIVLETPGFSENIVARFDREALGFKAL